MPIFPNVSKHLKKGGPAKVLVHTIGYALAGWLWFIKKTSPCTLYPSNSYQVVEAQMPVIFAMRHGQHFLIPLGKKPRHKIAVLISRSFDGGINAVAAKCFGLDPVRGSGSGHKAFKKVVQKGSIYGLLTLLRLLRKGVNVAMTAETRKTRPEHVGLGLVALARASGRPVVPVAYTTKWRLTLNSWDKTTINLPFGRSALVCGAPVYVATDADDQTLEDARRTVEKNLTEALFKAEQIVDGKDRGLLG